MKDGAGRAAIYLPETRRLKAFPRDRRSSRGGMLVAILTREETGPPGRHEIYLPQLTQEGTVWIAQEQGGGGYAERRYLPSGQSVGADEEMFVWVRKSCLNF